MKIKFFRSVLALLLLVAALITLALPQSVRADVGTIDVGITNSITANTTNTTAITVGTAVNIDNVDNIGLTFRGAGSTAQTGNIRFEIMTSGNGTTFATNSIIAWVVPATGLTPFEYYTNIPTAALGSVSHIQLYAIGNANGTCNITNASLTVVKKKIWPGR